MSRVKDDVVGLLNSLKHQQASVRLSAVKALIQEELEPELALRRFTAALADGSPEVRRAALQGLARLGRRSVPVLTRALAARDRAMRREAARGLASLGDHAAPAVPDLIRALQDDDRRLVQEAAKALGEIGPAAHPAIPQLLDLLHDTHFLACRLAAWALARVGQAAVPALVGALHDSDQYVCNEAAWALAHIGPAAREAVPALIDLLRSEGARAMHKVDRPADEIVDLEATTPFFIPGRGNREESFWIWIIRALGSIGPDASEAVADLLRLLRVGNGTFQQVAWQALRRIDPLVAAG